ncbi:MAG: transcription antitermination factor NusB [Peptococcaceae bacterium]|nr:transcription antitermination factor NusB [Peptococcaceae bacterium]
MGRRQAREAALQALFQVDVGGADPEKALADTAEMTGIAPDDIAFMRELVLGSLSHLRDIDRIISSLSRDWNIDRLARVDHNIMRLAAFEILYRDDIPFGATVNEAVELAKTYGGDDSGRFVNGILAQVGKKAAELKVPGAGEEKGRPD